MNTVSKMTIGCILATFVVAISSGSYSMIQVNAQIKQSSTIEEQISGIPEIRECQLLHPSWNPYITNNATAMQLFEDKNCWKQLARDPITGALPSSSSNNTTQG